LLDLVSFNSFNFVKDGKDSFRGEKRICNSGEFTTGILIRCFGTVGNVAHASVSESMCLCVQLLQYKKRCGNLEQQVLEKTSESEKLRLSVRLSGELYRLLL